ncbi:MAG TPA: hypothetical protein VGM10_06915 [Actinocrinis sp.]|jgi:hypothetical protein
MSSLTEETPNPRPSKQTEQSEPREPHAVLFVDGDLPESVELVDVDFELVNVTPVTLGAVVARRC